MLSSPRVGPGRAAGRTRDGRVVAFFLRGAPATSAARAALTDDFAVALPPWLLARALVGVSLLAARVIAGALHPLPEPVQRHVGEGLLGWDAQRYVELAVGGYSALPRTNLRFFPLLPMLARAVGFVVPGGPQVAALVLANAAALAFAAVLHRLALEETGDRALARRAAWFAACFPAGFVLAWGYTEALFLAVTALAFLAMRRRRWWWVAGLGVAAGLLRPVGLLLVAPVVIEVGAAWRRGERPGWSQLAAVAAAPIAAATYLAWVGRRFGDPLLPFTIQQTPAFRGAALDPVRAWWRTVEALNGGDVSVESLRAVWVVVVVALLVVCWRRWRPSYAVFATLLVLVAASTSRLGSFERYGFGAFPVLLALASISARPAVERVLLGVSSATMVLYGLLALLGAYVP